MSTGRITESRRREKKKEQLCSTTLTIHQFDDALNVKEWAGEAASTQPRVILFWRPGCPSCTEFTSTYQRLVRETCGRILHGSLDTSEGNGAAADRIRTSGRNITSVPTLAFYDARGNFVQAHSVGSKPYEHVLTLVNTIATSKGSSPAQRNVYEWNHSASSHHVVVYGPGESSAFRLARRIALQEGITVFAWIPMSHPSASSLLSMLRSVSRQQPHVVFFMIDPSNDKIEITKEDEEKKKEKKDHELEVGGPPSPIHGYPVVQVCVRGVVTGNDSYEKKKPHTTDTKEGGSGEGHGHRRRRVFSCVVLRGKWMNRSTLLDYIRESMQQMCEGSSTIPIPNVCTPYDR